MHTILLLLIGVVVSFTSCDSSPSESSHLKSRSSCGTNLHEIVIALHKYESVNGTLPPAFTVDTDGNRLHSWRSLILPYLDKNKLYEMIDFSKPWNHSSNKVARDKVVDVYVCPNASLEGGKTTYLGVYGTDSCFTGNVARKFSEITDGLNNTASVCDVHFENAVHWMSPYDLSIESILDRDLVPQSNHSEYLGFGFCDGSVRWVSLSLERNEIRALLTIAGGEEVNLERLRGR